MQHGSAPKRAKCEAVKLFLGLGPCGARSEILRHGTTDVFHLAERSRRLRAMRERERDMTRVATYFMQLLGAYSRRTDVFRTPVFGIERECTTSTSKPILMRTRIVLVTRPSYECANLFYLILWRRRKSRHKHDDTHTHDHT